MLQHGWHLKTLNDLSETNDHILDNFVNTKFPVKENL